MASDSTVLGTSQIPATEKQNKPLILPFLNTSFATEMKLYLALWPLWWFLGIEQLLPPFFLGWASLRYVIRVRGRVRLGDTVPFALLLSAWWLVPMPWVVDDLFDVFIRTFFIAFSQALLLFLFVNCVRTQREWRMVVTGLDLFSVYILVGALLFISGTMQGNIKSLMGYVLPASVYQSSEFFASIALRNFGTINPGWHGALPYRISSFALQPADLGTISLVLLPFAVWRFSQSRGMMRLGRLLLMGGLFFCFIYSEVRIAYIAFAVGLLYFGAWRVGLLQKRNRVGLWALLALLAAMVAGVGYFTYQDIADAIAAAFTNVRPGSILVRLYIYSETFRLLPQHLIAGWGSSIRIEGLPTIYSAGTHSTYLAMLFQHGIVGLLLYLGLWATIWRKALYWFRSQSPVVSRTFWVMVVITLLMFNIRESTASWMWDQTVTFAIWSLWGLIISAEQTHRLDS